MNRPERDAYYYCHKFEENREFLMLNDYCWDLEKYCDELEEALEKTRKALDNGNGKSGA